MECFGPECAARLLGWLRARAEEGVLTVPSGAGAVQQGLLWKAAPYQEDAPAITSAAEMAGAVEHLQYAVFRRYQNQLTRAERGRLDNSIENALFKIDRYLTRVDAAERAIHEAEVARLREEVRDHKERVERLRLQARRAELKLAQLTNLSPETFEEFVGELFEAMGFEVSQVGGSGDEGIDLHIRRGELIAIVQCKYHKRGVVGSPELQKFLGSVHHAHAHKGYFVTTSTFSLAAEKFAAENPIELVDGPRIVELVTQALGPGARKEPEPTWF
ncbi:restriction endonuclease [Paludisphaera rhizosphaerae]|uniref:restriction endonuclease n=1 Tax=Paludisphaera rhizosphaerae TaxID=2711216 RepID=UPI0013ECFC24|nr:restriction endonuclease [Paludisphaera rhizosphaerae]